MSFDPDDAEPQQKMIGNESFDVDLDEKKLLNFSHLVGGRGARGELDSGFQHFTFPSTGKYILALSAYPCQNLCLGVFEEGKFCEAYHKDTGGWITCKSCGNWVHCGCAVSVESYILLDAGGVECMMCTRKNSNINMLARPSAVAGLYPQPFNVGDTSADHFQSSPRMKKDVDYLKWISGESSASVVRKEDPSERVNPLNLAMMNSRTNENAAVGMVSAYHALHKDEVSLNCLQETQICIGRLPVDPQGQRQLRSQCSPWTTYRQLEQISGDSNSVIIPLFEKLLTPTDAKRFGNLALSRKCAEDYFPKVTKPEGLPIKVQDAKGNEWVLQLRFWPTSKGRQYILEGLAPCFQPMQQQAGDTVTFSQIDPEGNLVIGFRKAASVPPPDQDQQSLKCGSGVSKDSEASIISNSVISAPLQSANNDKDSNSYSSIDQVKAADPVGTWSKIDRSGYIAKDVAGAKLFISNRRRKSSSLAYKRKRRRTDNEDLIELKLTWEEAQGLLCPPPNLVPDVVVVEGYEFEEYEEAPILGKSTIFTTDHDGSLCSSAQEITSKQLQDVVSSNKTGQIYQFVPILTNYEDCKESAVNKDENTVEVSEGLCTLGNIAIQGQDNTLPPVQTTTKHPCHSSGCTCIVCIQPPTGKGLEHKETCICNVCSIVSRCRLSLLKHFAEDRELARKKLEQLQQPDNPLLEDDTPISPMSFDPDDAEPQQKMIGNESFDVDLDEKKLLNSSHLVRLFRGNHQFYSILHGPTSLSSDVDMA
ncbi:hypothetical protein IFM89_015385 [Coptis chinensis]|uniref:TF-B3 domain-containing protein n=1 Tax=Coptis chinensis TaxID=261450 RepID=A0A835LZK2_9MAGN|nr:hypothetical protein IFM89_015385 [Coptis chinensis]